MLPSFNRMGSKVRIRKWLVSHFPRFGANYIEVFCGNANVYFESFNQLKFQTWSLNDKYTMDFLIAIKEIDIRNLPPAFGESEETEIRFKQCLNLEHSLEELVMEHLVSFGGKGYRNGIPKEGHKRYIREKLISKINCAKDFLRHAELYSQDWEKIEYNKFKADDFLYFDPPYYGTKTNYPNINHEKLITEILPLLSYKKIKWAVSGYDNWLYREFLNYTNRYSTIRNSEIKGAIVGELQEVEEVLWTNY